MEPQSQPKHYPCINVVVVRQEAMTSSFQADSWDQALKTLCRMANDQFYGLTGADFVFMRDVADKHGELEHHTLKEYLAEAKFRGLVPYADGVSIRH